MAKFGQGHQGIYDQIQYSNKFEKICPQVLMKKCTKSVYSRKKGIFVRDFLFFRKTFFGQTFWDY
jgi:hypothetical protein